MVLINDSSIADAAVYPLLLRQCRVVYTRAFGGHAHRGIVVHLRERVQPAVASARYTVRKFRWLSLWIPPVHTAEHWAYVAPYLAQAALRGFIQQTLRGAGNRHVHRQLRARLDHAHLYTDPLLHPSFAEEQYRPFVPQVCGAIVKLEAQRERARQMKRRYVRQVGVYRRFVRRWSWHERKATGRLKELARQGSW